MPMSRSRTSVRASWLGRVPYRRAWAVQRALVERVRAGEAPSTLLLLEHEPVYSMGRRATMDNVLWDAGRREERGVELVWSDRGGDVTYHGPGQLTGYPVVDLQALGTDILALCRGLELALIEQVAELGITAHAGGEGYAGVWASPPTGAGPVKLAAIGVKLNHHVSNHGFALNLSTDMDYFEGIVPCGLHDRRAGSVAQLTGSAPSVEDAGRDFARHFSSRFGVELDWVDAGALLALEAAAPPEPPPPLRVIGLEPIVRSTVQHPAS